MLFGITAVICAVLAGNGGFSQAVIDLSHVQAETNPDLQGAFEHVRTRFAQPARCCGAHGPRYVGPSANGAEVLRHQKRPLPLNRAPSSQRFFAMVVAGGSYFLGGFGTPVLGQIEMSAAGTPIYDSIIPTMLSTLPDLLVGLVIVLVLSASMSTLSSACTHLVEHAHARPVERQRREEHG